MSVSTTVVGVVTACAPERTAPDWLRRTGVARYGSMMINGAYAAYGAVPPGADRIPHRFTLIPRGEGLPSLVEGIPPLAFARPTIDCAAVTAAQFLCGAGRPFGDAPVHPVAAEAFLAPAAATDALRGAGPEYRETAVAFSAACTVFSTAAARDAHDVMAVLYAGLWGFLSRLYPSLHFHDLYRADHARLLAFLQTCVFGAGVRGLLCPVLVGRHFCALPTPGRPGARARAGDAPGAEFVADAGDAARAAALVAFEAPGDGAPPPEPSATLRPPPLVLTPTPAALAGLVRAVRAATGAGPRDPVEAATSRMLETIDAFLVGAGVRRAASAVDAGDAAAGPGAGKRMRMTLAVEQVCHRDAARADGRVPARPLPPVDAIALKDWIAFATVAALERARESGGHYCVADDLHFRTDVINIVRGIVPHLCGGESDADVGTALAALHAARRVARVAPRSEAGPAQWALAFCYEQEALIAAALRLVAGRTRDVADGAAAASLAADAAGLCDEQARAVERAVCGGVTVIHGAGGTGKTHVIVAIVDALRRLGSAAGGAVLLTSFKNTAVQMLAKLVEDRLGVTAAGVGGAGGGGDGIADAADPTRVFASTIHYINEVLKSGGEATRTRLPVGTVIVDEAMQVSTPLMWMLLKSLSMGHLQRVVIVGHAEQMRPVEPGEPMMHISRALPPECTVELVRGFRHPSPEFRAVCDAIMRHEDVATETADGSFAVRAVLPPLFHTADASVAAAMLALRDFLVEVDPGRSAYGTTIAVAPFNALAEHAARVIHAYYFPGLAAGAVTVGMRVVTQKGQRRLAPDAPLPTGVAREDIYPHGRGQVGVVTAIGPPTGRAGERIVIIDGRHAVVLPRSHPESVLAPGHALTVTRAQGLQWRNVAVLFPPAQNFADPKTIYTAVSRAQGVCRVITNAAFYARALAAPIPEAMSALPMLMAGAGAPQ